MKKLLVLDLDGTLIDKLDRIKDIKTINELKSKFTLTLATGRSYNSALKFAKMLELEVPFICFDGALLSDIEENIYFKREMSFKEVMEIFSLLKPNNYWTIFYQKFSLLNSNMMNMGIIMKHWREEYKSFMGLFYHNSIFKTVISSYSYDTIKSIRNYLIQKRTSNRGYYIYPSGKKKGLYVIDIFNELSDKGEALKILKEIYKFDFIVSIGDYLNDIGMFKVSDISIAMNHSPDKVKQQANFTIKNLGELLSCIKI